MKDPKNDIYYKLLSKLLQIYKFAGVLLLLSAFAVLSFNIFPELSYVLDPNGGVIEAQTLIGTSINSIVEPDTQSEKISYSIAKALPAVDPNLPKEPTLRVPRIGVDAKLYIGQGEEMLDKGVWLPTDASNPLTSLPMVMSSHRFGKLSWSKEYRDRNWFYRLSELRPGDEITVIWEQRPFKYVVQRTAEGENNVELREDLLLFTCKHFRSPVRILVFANKAW